MTREQRDFLRKQIDTFMRKRLAGEPTRRGPRRMAEASKRPQKVKSGL